MATRTSAPPVAQIDCASDGVQIRTAGNRGSCGGYLNRTLGDSLELVEQQHGALLLVRPNNWCQKCCHLAPLVKNRSQDEILSAEIDWVFAKLHISKITFC